MPLVKHSTAACILGLCLALSACAETEHVDGQLPSPDKLALIEPGISTRDDVAEILGTPSTTPLFNDGNWYYIRRITHMIAFFDPVLAEQKVIGVSFDSEGLVDAISFYLEADGHEIEMVERTTPTQGRQMTIWDQLLSNLGKLPGGDKSTGREFALPGGTSSQ